MQMADYLPFFEANSLLNDPQAFRQKMADDGYLFFRGIGPIGKIRQARHDVLETIARAGWIDPAKLDKANWSGAGPFTEGDPEYMRVYKEILGLPSFLAVPEDPIFIDMIAKIVDSPVLLHKLRIGRVTFPNNTAQTTAAHQDWMYIRGTPATYTIWTPLGDCPRALGGLAVLPGSHKEGFIEHVNHPEKKYAGMGLPENQWPAGQWVAGDFALGDFIVFHSHTVHKALPNLTSNTLRLSTDNRYQKQGEEMAEISAKSHYQLRENVENERRGAENAEGT